MWLLMQPRDFMTTFMFAGMILGAVVGLVVAHPKMNLPMYTGFHNATSGDLFPILFVTVACGAVSGFHSLQTVRLLSERHLRSFLPVLPDFWKCSASRYTEHSAS